MGGHNIVDVVVAVVVHTIHKHTDSQTWAGAEYIFTSTSTLATDE